MRTILTQSMLIAMPPLKKKTSDHSVPEKERRCYRTTDKAHSHNRLPTRTWT